MNASLNRLLLTGFSLLALSLFSVYGQEADSQKALKYFEKAQGYYNKGEWAACEEELLKTIQADSSFADAYIMLADVYQDMDQPLAAVDQYRKALKFRPEREDIVYSLLANLLFSLERYSEATEYYRRILEYPRISSGFKLAVEEKLVISTFRSNLMDHPVAFDPINLGPAVNTGADEYINALSAEGDGIFFTKRIKSTSDPSREFSEDFYFAKMHGDSLEDALLLTYPPGKENDAGAICIAPDKRLLVFTACNRKDSYGSCDLYYSVKTGDKWAEAKNLGSVVNSEFWDAQPSISPDGTTIYFISNRPGGSGSSDVWKTERSGNGNWGKPINLGFPVNTNGSEMAPFIHFDNQTLYFSSDGHKGMGGSDLFKSVRSGKSWTSPENLGYPVNSSADELVIIVNAGGDEGYISNNNIEGYGGYDVYKFNLDKSARPVPVTYLKGKVFDKVTLKPLEAAFELIDLEKDSLIFGARSDKISGEFLVCLPCDRNYALNVSHDSYLFYSDHFPLSEMKSQSDPYLKDIPLEPVAVGNKMVLRNIFFKTDQYALEPESFPELDKLNEFLIKNPAVKIEIGGHTDNQGTSGYNADLSQKRAQSVAFYLVGVGVDRSRISYLGYGENEPVSSNETQEGRALNRRTEIKITGLE